jgi:signal transduction histidine kinase
MSLSLEKILAHSAALQQARSIAEVMRAVAKALESLTRYRSAWIAWFDPVNTELVRLLAASGQVEETVWETSPLIPRTGDAMLEEIAAGLRPVVVLDARTDERTNKAQVERFGNRTIINVPIILGSTVRGSLGTGSFLDEGVVPPTEEELEALVVFSTLLAPAFDRVEALVAKERAEKEYHDLQRHLESLQRIELMGVMAAGVAHDLNNLLAVGLASLTSIDARRLGPDSAAVADATSAMERMRDVSRQLLELGKDERKVRQRLDINDAVSSTIQLVRSTIPVGVTVTHERLATPIVEANPIQLTQAVANLVLNARDAVGETGRITLRVDEANLDAKSAARMRGGRAGRYARLRISDTGPGIPPELHERVFDPLFTTKPMGTGLGLAVVSKVTSQHQGFISLQSEHGHGASFELYLPAV